MKAFHWHLILYVIFTTHYVFVYTKNPKIVALVPGHNDGRFLSNCFKALSRYVDSIIYLDDASTDNSVEIAQLLVEECNIEQIICKKNWIRHAGADRNILLAAGRALGGTHFVLIDADEMPTANLLHDQTLRRIILNLKPGERLALAWIQLWRSPYQYRCDQQSVWFNNYKDIAFCDDGTCYYHDRKLCESRTPDTLEGKTWFIEGYNCGLLHFQFVNFENLLRKQAWYRCQERIIQPHRTIKEINQEYAPSKNENGLILKEAPFEWFLGYDFFDLNMLNQKECWREQEAINWFAKYGLCYFAGLDLWDVKWAFDDYISPGKTFLETFIICNYKKGTYIELGNPQTDYNPAKILHAQKNWVKEKHVSFAQPIDLCIVHENKMLHATDFANVPRILVLHEKVLFDELNTQLTMANYVKVPYNDHGYYYYIKQVSV